MKNLVKNSIICVAALTASYSSIAAQVFATDVIVQGSECIGIDCVNGESFGFDTLRLKENNLRIKFQDTSNSASFPSNDWQITVNDSNNGGANKFAIDDVTAGYAPFVVMAGAGANSLVINNNRVGFGTSTPLVELHSVDGDTPTLRLEQNGSNGYRPQTWDVAGNEANFFVRDVTNGSKLPFRIKPGANENSLFIQSSGNVNLNSQQTSDPAQLYVQDDATGNAVTTATASGIKVVNTNPGTRILMTLKNNGASGVAIEDTASGDLWIIANGGSGLAFYLNGVSPANLMMRLNDNGSLDVRGSVNENAF